MLQLWTKRGCLPEAETLPIRREPVILKKYIGICGRIFDDAAPTCNLQVSAMIPSPITVVKSVDTVVEDELRTKRCGAYRIS